MTVFDHVMGACLIGSFTLCAYHKTLRYAVTGEELQLMWLFQPCYVVEMMLIFCIYSWKRFGLQDQMRERF